MNRKRLFMLGWLLLAGCSNRPNPPDAGSAADAGTDDVSLHTFGVFDAFSPDYGDFMTRMGQDLPAYQAWAGARLKDLGATWTRSNMQLVWDEVEPEKGGAFDWSGARFRTDEVFGAATRSGVEYLASFAEGGGKVRDPMSDLAAYQRFVRAAVERYDGDGVDDAPNGARIRWWQIGNESPFWTRPGRTPAQYADWAEATATAIREADASAHVVLTASADSSQLDALHAQAIPLLKSKGVRFDAIDLHHWGAANEITIPSLAATKALLAANGFSAVEIWSCEHGTYVGSPNPQAGQCSPACNANQACVAGLGCVPRCGPGSCPPRLPRCDASNGLCGEAEQTQADQARSMIQRFTINRIQGVKRILWNNLVGWRCFLGTCDGVWDRIGLIADGYGPGETVSDVGKPRLAYFTFKLLVERIDGRVAEALGERSAGPGTHVFAFRSRSTSKVGFVAWADTPSGASLDFSGPRATVLTLITDSAGSPLKQQQLESSGGKLAVQLDATPVWIAE